MVFERLADVPGLAALRDLAHARPERLWLVGGAVRDALLGAPVRDLDVVVEGDALAVARALGDVVAEHERFGTAEAVVGGGKVNLAGARSERYAAPGALPDVRLGATLAEDLRRRDFTVNAIAVALDDGEEAEVPGAREDLAARRLRVLHDASFVDDPTRLYRLARYAARLGLEVEPHTAQLALAAVMAPETVSCDRVRQELRLMLGEPDPVAALVAARTWTSTAPDVEPDLARAALALLPEDGRADVVLVASGPVARSLQLAQVADDTPVQLARAGMGLLDETTAARNRAGQTARAPELAAVLRDADRPSAIAAAVEGWPPEAVALAGALGAEEPARAWLDGLRHVRLEITGDDLVAAGVPEGPAVGAALRRARDARLDGTIAAGREAELAAALASGP